MHSKSSNIGNNFIQRPRNFFQNLRQQEQYVRSEVGYSAHWRHPHNIICNRLIIRKRISKILSSNFRHLQAKEISDIATTVEEELFKHAASEEEFGNEQTLLQRVRTELHKRRKESQQQLHSSVSYKTVCNPIDNATNHSAVAANNMHDFPNGLVHEPVYPPHEGLASTTTSTGMDELSQVFYSGGGRNLAASTNSIGFRFPQQHAHNLAADNRHGLPNGIYSNSIVQEPVFPAHEGFVSTTYTGMDELSQIFASGGGRNLADSTKSIGFSFPQQHANNLAADNGHGFPNGGLLNHSIVHEPVCPPHEGSTSTTYTGMDELSQILIFGGGSNPAASSKSIDFSFPQQHENNLEMNLNKYGNCLGTVQKNEPLALHTAMGKSLQSESSNLMVPQDVIKGKSTTFQTSSSFVDQNQNCCQMSGKKTQMFPRFPTKPINGAPSGNSEVMLRPTKRLKMESASGINNSSSEQWTPKMFQPLAMKNNVIDLTSEDGQTSEDSNLRRHGTVDRNNLETVTSMHTLRSNAIAADIEHIDGKTGLSDFMLEHFKSPMHDSMRDEIMNKVVDDLVGQTFKNQTMNSKGLEADHMSEESGPSDHDNVDLSNIKETVIRSDSKTHTVCKDPIAADTEDIIGRTGVAECIENNVINDTFGQAFESETIHSKGFEVVLISDESDSDPMNHDSSDCSSPSETEVRSSSSMDTLSEGPVTADESDFDPMNDDSSDSSSSSETEVRSSSSMDTLSEGPVTADVWEINGRTGFNLAGVNAEKKDSEQKADEKMESKFSSATIKIVSLTDLFTKNQIIQHIRSLKKQGVQSIPGEKTGIAAYECQLCGMEKLSFAPVPIYCLCCGKRIRRNSKYYHKPEESDTPHCFCTLCYNKSRGDHITFNAISVPKKLLYIKKNDEELDEGWVECSKCGKWQHEICALYNKRRDLDSCAEYTCPICRLKEIEEGVRVPLPKTAIFGAKDLPSTMLSNHLENRLYKRLMQEKEDCKKSGGTMNLDEVLAAETLSVKVVLSVDKELKVKKQFLDIIPEENYPAEFSYRSKVILLFQRVDGADICLFAMYVQEFGAECGNPNHRSVYISYLDSVNYFRPKRETIRGEALRTFVYHEILIGYLDFCKKRGFTTCYIWACPPTKGEDYILYCHPDTQKTPKDDKLRHWYLSMLRKASDENIVVGLSNIYDIFFVPTGKCDSKVTASRLPYFDGDYWSTRAMDLAWHIEKESGGEYEKALNKHVTKRALKAMGHVNPSKDTAKDILVMQKLGQNILPSKENFIVVHLQHTCVHCQEVIVSGKRWFCTECKNFQECERCHTADSHTSTSGEKHRLRQVLVEDIPFDTKDNDIILDNQLFENRHRFLSFCQRNQLQFDMLRRAKYSSMMILHQLQSYAQLTVGTTCSICGEPNAFQDSWKCEICPEFNSCSACYKEKGAKCHAHKLSQTDSTSPSVQGNEESEPHKLSQTDLTSPCVQGNEESEPHKLSTDSTSPSVQGNEESEPHKLTQTDSTSPSVQGNRESERKPPRVEELHALVVHASECNLNETQPCSYPHCLKMKKVISHAIYCDDHASGGCSICKKALMALTAHSKICRVSHCRIPCCRTLKKRKWTETQSEYWHIDAVLESMRRTC